MKPLHVGFLVIGAALAGGLAVKVSQPPVYQGAPRAVAAEPAPTPAAPVTPTVTEPAATMAPPPVYQEEPRHIPPKPVVVARWAKAKPAAAPAPVAPVEVAKVEAAPAELPVKPPVPYQPVPEPVASQPVQTAETPAPAPAPSLPPAQVTLRPGTLIAVRLDQTISDRMSPGDTFQASLAEPLVVDGFIIGERGAHASGRIVDSRPAGRLGGSSEIQLALTSFETADGQKIAISTEPWLKQGVSSRNQDVAKVGGGAALGAIIGAIAGGGKGAAIGAGAGGVLGAGTAAATRPKNGGIASETIIRFPLANRVTITERQL